MILIAFRCSASVSSHAPRVVYPSIVWVRASIPVATLQTHRYARHHVGVHDRHNGDVVGVYTGDLARVLVVCLQNKWSFYGRLSV